MWELRFHAEIPAEQRPRQRKRAERRSRKPRRVGVGLAAILAGLYVLSPSGPQAKLEPNALDFETQTVRSGSRPQTVTLANQGAQPLAVQEVALTGDQATDFTLAANTCGGASLDPGKSCTMTVSFSPQEAGLRQAELRIVDNAADSPHSIVLRGTGMAVPPSTPGVAISPPLLEFGSQEIPTASEPQGITFTSTSTASLEITRIALAGEQAGEFDIRSDLCTGTTLAPGDNCTIRVRFTPAGGGSRRADLQVFDNTSESPHLIPLAGSGTEPPKPVAVLTPPLLDFKAQTLQVSSASQRVTVSSQGLGLLQIATVSLEGDTRDFAVQQDRCSGRRLAATESCTIDVSFAPSRTQLRNATLVVPDNSSESPHRVPLSGIGAPVPRAIAEVTPESLIFEDQEVLTASGPRIVRIINRGTAPLGVQQVRLSGPGGDAYQVLEDSCSGSSLGADESCRMQVRFAPRRTGSLEATLIITDDAEGSPQSIALSGTGTAHAEPAITLRPTTLDFAQRTIGGGVVADILGALLGAKGVEVTNTGSAPLSIGDVGIEGENTADFTTGSECRHSTIAPNQTCRITVNFQPKEPGQRTAVLVIHHNAPGSPHRVVLSGTGEAQPVGRLAVDPPTLDFGDRALRTRTSLTLTATNTGSGPVTIRRVNIAGSTVAGFAKTDDRCEHQQIPPGQSCVITIVFAPLTGGAGPRNATLTLSHDGEGGQHQVPLRGSVVIPVGRLVRKPLIYPL